MKHKLIRNKEHLLACINACEVGEQIDLFLLLGICRSSKTLIKHDDGHITLCNEIDGTTHLYLSVDEMLEDTGRNNIKRELGKGYVFLYDFNPEKILSVGRD